MLNRRGFLKGLFAAAAMLPGLSLIAKASPKKIPDGALRYSEEKGYTFDKGFEWEDGEVPINAKKGDHYSDLDSCANYEYNGSSWDLIPEDYREFLKDLQTGKKVSFSGTLGR